MNMQITIHRGPSTQSGTLGVLTVADFTCFTLELPWRNNMPNISCIPAGDYTCSLVKSPRFGQVYQVNAVPGRSHILIHAGNYAGDASAGLRTDVAGCILLGRKVGTMHGQLAVLASRITVRRFMAAMAGLGITNFTLKLREH